jgi:hypothetical protein
MALDAWSIPGQEVFIMTGAVDVPPRFAVSRFAVSRYAAIGVGATVRPGSVRNR